MIRGEQLESPWACLSSLALRLELQSEPQQTTWASGSLSESQ